MAQVSNTFTHCSSCCYHVPPAVPFLLFSHLTTAAMPAKHLEAHTHTYTHTHKLPVFVPPTSISSAYRSVAVLSIFNTTAAWRADDYVAPTAAAAADAAAAAAAAIGLAVCRVGVWCGCN